MSEQIEQYMRTLKPGGLTKEWRSVVYRDPEQYVRELPELELREREANRINRMIKKERSTRSSVLCGKQNC